MTWLLETMRPRPVAVRGEAPTLVETERQLVAMLDMMAALRPETDEEIDIWSDRLSPLQCAIEAASPTTAEEAGVILRQVIRNAAGHGIHELEPQIQRVADWLEPGHGFTCADARILRPCPFCGERKHLTIEEGTFERVGVRDGKVEEIVWTSQTEIGNAEYADTIQCQVCDTVAALDVWNHTRPASDYALLRDFDEPAEAEAERVAA